MEPQPKWAIIFQTKIWDTKLWDNPFNCDDLRVHESLETLNTFNLRKPSFKTLPEAQRTQGIASKTWVISPANGGSTCNSSKFGHQMAQLALVPNLATRWHHLHLLQIWPSDGATCISCKFSHQVAPFALVANLTARWRHLHKLQIWPPDSATCISCKFGHQMAPLA